MRGIEQAQIRKIYAIGSALGIVEPGSSCDGLHALVGSVAGKDSVRALSHREAGEVIARLEALQGRPSPRPKTPEKRACQSRPGGVTPGQQKKVWALMYELKAHDGTPNSVSLGDRLCAVIKKELKLDAAARDPFAWLSYQQGNRLIEMLKRYAASAKKKGGDVGGTEV